MKLTINNIIKRLPVKTLVFLTKYVIPLLLFGVGVIYGNVMGMAYGLVWFVSALILDSFMNASSGTTST